MENEKKKSEQISDQLKLSYIFNLIIKLLIATINANGSQ